MKTLRINIHRVKIRTRHLPNMNQECYPLDLQVCCFYCDEEVLVTRFDQFMHFSSIAGMSLTLRAVML